MTYSRRNKVEEQQEARLKAEQIAAICKNLHISLDPIDWQDDGMHAHVRVNNIQISDLLDLSNQDDDSILRRIQIKLFEHAALATIGARPGLKALIWSPVTVIQQPQEFLSLWIITIETDERVAIAEYIRHGERVYEHYQLNTHDEQQLASLFGPMHTGEYKVGDTITIAEHDRRCTGEIIYILPPGKAIASRKNSARGYHTIQGKA
ncbi:MAG TPA: hypothetical protein VGN34_23235, partial [Ktedonobacteraceae bacterium]